MLFGTVDAERHMMNTADHPSGTGAAPAQSDSTFKIQDQLRDRGVAIIQVAGRTDSNAVHKISQTIDDEKSLLGYMSGLLVFMGLIGTFIGLLHMQGMPVGLRVDGN